MSIEGTAKTEYASLSGKIHTFVVDKTLSVSGACADSKAVGDEIERLDDIVPEAKEAYEEAKAAYDEAVSGMENAAREVAEEVAKNEVGKLTAGDVGAYTKDEVVSDATKTLFGLGADAVPDDVFSWIGQYNTHWWSILHGQASIGYSEVKSDVDKNIIVFERATREYYYSDSIEIDQSTGAVNLVNPKTMTLTYFGLSSEITANCEQLKGKYVKNFVKYPDKTDISSVVFYVDPSASIRYENDGGTIYQIVIYGNGSGLYTGQAKIITSQAYNIPAGETTYEHSADRNAYPDSGTVDGLTYQYLGVPFQKFPSMPQIATGSYTGTGTAGNSGKNSVVCGFKPKVFIVYTDNYSQSDGTYSSWGQSYQVFLANASKIPVHAYSNSSDKTYYTFSGEGVEWYNDYNSGAGTYTIAAQMNTAGTTYYWVAIG